MSTLETPTVPTRSVPEVRPTRRAPRHISAGSVARFIGILALAVIIFLPVYVSFVGAFSANGTLVRNGLIPDFASFTLSNFTEALTTIPLAQGYLVSVAVVAVQTAAQILTGALAAYALVFPQWRFRNLAFTLVVITLAVPGESIVIPNYELVSSIGLRDTILGVALPYLAAGYPIFLLRQAFANVPREIWEASRLDGCGDMRTLFAVIIPAVRPQMTTAIIWSALAAWNGFFWPLLITDSANARTIQVGISQLASSEVGNPAVIFAGAVLVVVPTILLVIVAQRFLINGLARGVLN